MRSLHFEDRVDLPRESSSGMMSAESWREEFLYAKWQERTRLSFIQRIQFTIIKFLNKEKI